MTEEERRLFQKQMSGIDFGAVGKDLSAATIASGRGDYQKAKDLAAGQSAGVLGATTDKTSADIQTNKDAQKVIERPEEEEEKRNFADWSIPEMAAYRPEENVGKYSTDVNSDALEARRKALQRLLKV
jgi:hypothetical protein